MWHTILDTKVGQEWVLYVGAQLMSQAHVTGVICQTAAQLAVGLGVSQCDTSLSAAVI